MKIVYTKHAEKKLKDLAMSGIKVLKRKINTTVRNPDHIDKETDYPKLIASGKLDTQHILRVVYKIDDGIIVIITCYPAKKRRYY